MPYTLSTHRQVVDLVDPRSAGCASAQLPVLGPASRLPAPGKLEAMAVDGAQFVVANVGGRYHALDGLCEHAGAPLPEGTLNGCRLTCPLHGWVYDVTDGRIVKPALHRRARSYTVRVTDDTVRVAERD